VKELGPATKLVKSIGHIATPASADASPSA
jgi:hypothetical protein